MKFRISKKIKILLLAIVSIMSQTPKEAKDVYLKKGEGKKLKK